MNYNRFQQHALNRIDDAHARFQVNLREVLSTAHYVSAGAHTSHPSGLAQRQHLGPKSRVCLRLTHFLHHEQPGAENDSPCGTGRALDGGVAKPGAAVDSGNTLFEFLRECTLLEF